MIEKYLADERIVNGLHMPMDMDFILGQPHHIYDYGDGFVLFVVVNNKIIASCGFFKNASNIFKKCKEALLDFTKDKIVKVNAMVYNKNMPSRVLLNALGFKFLNNCDFIPDIRLYSYEVK